MQGNAGECQGNVTEWVQSARAMQENAGGAGVCQGNVQGVGAMCQGDAGECQRNEQKWVKSARGMQGNAMGTYGSGK